MKFIAYLSFLLICYFTYGFYLSQFELNIISQSGKNDYRSPFYDYKGIINVHTNKSLGSANYSQIINSAKLANVDFIIFTDLNIFRPQINLEGYYGNLLALAGAKYSYLDSRIISYSPTSSAIASDLGEAQTYLADYLSQPSSNNKSSLLILAHPFRTGFTWNGDLPPGLDGFELLNLKTFSIRSWEDSKLSTLWSIFIYPFNSKLSFARLFKEPSEELALLDTSFETHHYLGFAGSEASARSIPLSNYLLKFPSYQKTFEIMSNHLLLKSELTGNLKNDRIKIFQALKNGNFYMALDILGNPEGFYAYISDHQKKYLMGSKIHFSKDLTLHVKLPAAPKCTYETVVYRNGSHHFISSQPEFSHSISEPGQYRVQVRVIPTLPLPDAKKWLTWIYSNPFFIDSKF